MLIIIFFACKTPSSLQKNVVSSMPVVAWGVAQIYQGDIAHAKERALMDAKKNIVKKKLGSLIESKTVIDSGVWLKGKLSSKSEGLVKDYNILEKYMNNSIYKIQISAQVYEIDILHEIEDLLLEGGNPSVFIEILSTALEHQKEKPDDILTTKLGDLFLKKGFNIKANTHLSKIISSSTQLKKILEIIKKYDTDFDILVFGVVSCFPEKVKYKKKYMNNIRSVQIQGNISVVDIHTNDLITSFSVRQTHANFSKKLACKEGMHERYIQDGFNSIFTSILQKWRQSYANGRKMVIKLSGQFNYKQLYELKKIMTNEIRGVVNIIERSFTTNQALWEIIYQGNTKDLIEEIINKKFSMSISVKKIKGTTIAIQIY